MLYAHKPTSESLNPAASLTNVPFRIAPSRLSGPTIHEPLRPAKDAAIHTSIHGDSKSLPNNRTAKVQTTGILSLSPIIGLQRYTFLFIRVRLCSPKRVIFMFF